MQTADGKQGLVPVTYIDKLDVPPESAVAEKKTVSPENSVSSNNINALSSPVGEDEVRLWTAESSLFLPETPSCCCDQSDSLCAVCSSGAVTPRVLFVALVLWV